MNHEPNDLKPTSADIQSDDIDVKNESHKHRIDRIYHVVKDSADEEDDLILSMTVMENPPAGG